MRTFVLLLSLTPATALGQWLQWAANPQHTERSAAVGQPLDRNFVNLVYDPLTEQETFATNGLLVHYQAPLVDDDTSVYMMTKGGHFETTSFATQTFSETKYVWSNGALASQWQFTSDWKPPGAVTSFFEPVFHPALANGVLYVPGAGGSVFKVNKQTGAGIRISPFPSLDANTYVVSPLTADALGNILFNVIQVQPSTGDFYAHDVTNSWLVRIAANDVVDTVSYATLTVGAPRATDLCQNQFTNEFLPWPPSPDAVPGSIVCGSQRPALNASPAVAPDGTIYVVTRAQLNGRSAYLVAVTPDLRQKWMATLRDRFNDGCGVPISAGGTLPPNGQPGGCRVGSRLGVDPATNTPGGGRVNDSGSSTPVVAPDGSILYGAYTRYNYSQGHLMHFAANGTYLGAYTFGWDVTPAIYVHDGTYSIITKENRYNTGTYCSGIAICGNDRNATNPEYPEGYFVTQLDSSMRMEWSYRNTNRLSCGREADGSVACVDDHPVSFEWCVNAFVVDRIGTVYANSEDGWLYAIGQGGVLKGRIFQQLALGAAYTPTSMDAVGRIYSQNDGHLFVAGGVRQRTVAHR